MTMDLYRFDNVRKFMCTTETWESGKILNDKEEFERESQPLLKESQQKQLTLKTSSLRRYHQIRFEKRGRFTYGEQIGEIMNNQIITSTRENSQRTMNGGFKYRFDVHQPKVSEENVSLSRVTHNQSLDVPGFDFKFLEALLHKINEKLLKSVKKGVDNVETMKSVVHKRADIKSQNYLESFMTTILQPIDYEEYQIYQEESEHHYLLLRCSDYCETPNNQRQHCQLGKLARIQGGRSIVDILREAADGEGNKVMSEKRITLPAVIYYGKITDHGRLLTTPPITMILLIMLMRVTSVSVKSSVRNIKGKHHVSDHIKVKCQLCVDKNRATFWCNNCQKNICSFCKMYHEKVWTVMNHEVEPLQ